MDRDVGLGERIQATRDVQEAQHELHYNSL